MVYVYSKETPECAIIYRINLPSAYAWIHESAGVCIEPIMLRQSLLQFYKPQECRNVWHSRLFRTLALLLLQHSRMSESWTDPKLTKTKGAISEYIITMGSILWHLFANLLIIYLHSYTYKVAIAVCNWPISLNIYSSANICYLWWPSYELRFIYNSVPCNSCSIGFNAFDKMECIRMNC